MRNEFLVSLSESRLKHIASVFGRAENKKKNRKVLLNDKKGQEGLDF